MTASVAVLRLPYKVYSRVNSSGQTSELSDYSLNFVVLDKMGASINTILKCHHPKPQQQIKLS